MSLIRRIRRLFGRKTQIPEPPDDGFRPSTFSEGYGSVGETEEAGIPVVRCESRKREGSRSWRCQAESRDGTHPGEDHYNIGGGRRW